MTQREIWNFKSWLCFFCHSGKKPNLVSIVSSKLYTFMMGNAICFNIILSLRFVKGFVPACCPVCTRRKKICKHLCHNVPIYMYIYKGNVLIMDCTCISFTFFVEVKAHAHQRVAPPVHKPSLSSLMYDQMRRIPDVSITQEWTRTTWTRLGLVLNRRLVNDI